MKLDERSSARQFSGDYGFTPTTRERSGAYGWDATDEATEGGTAQSFSSRRSSLHRSRQSPAQAIDRPLVPPIAPARPSLDALLVGETLDRGRSDGQRRGRHVIAQPHTNTGGSSRPEASDSLIVPLAQDRSSSSVRPRRLATDSFIRSNRSEQGQSDGSDGALQQRQQSTAAAAFGREVVAAAHAPFNESDNRQQRDHRPSVSPCPCPSFFSCIRVGRAAAVCVAPGLSGCLRYLRRTNCTATKQRCRYIEARPACRKVAAAGRRAIDDCRC